jgi:nitrite reductase (NO-forming)
MTDHAPHGDESGVVSRRAVIGATFGGIGAATLVGVAAATSWPDSNGGNQVTSNGSSGAPAVSVRGAEIDVNAKPPTDWQARDPVLPAAPAAREHRITVAAREGVGEIAPGTTQQLWSFDGQVPGPTYRGRVGDQFLFTLTNKGQVGHSIDFHASKVAWNDKMRTIQPGESLEYPFAAKHAGIFMYHCGTPPVLHHIGNGMYGAIIIDPPDLAPVDHEFVFVQSEFYLGEQGQPGDLTKMQQEAWDAVVFNGYVNQYQHRPIRVEPNQRIRAWVLDAGPSENCSFHVIGTIFDTVFKEGAYLLRPGAGSGGSQALDLQPAQGGFVEFSFDEAGLYPFVTHKFANPGRGPLAVYQAGNVDTAAGEAGH